MISFQQRITGDSGKIVIGAYTNVQDGTVIASSTSKNKDGSSVETRIGDFVTIGKLDAID